MEAGADVVPPGATVKLIAASLLPPHHASGKRCRSAAAIRRSGAKPRVGGQWTQRWHTRFARKEIRRTANMALMPNIRYSAIIR